MRHRRTDSAIVGQFWPLGLDGAHLKAKYLGILLAATGVDANGALFPLAYAVVDAENDDN